MNNSKKTFIAYTKKSFCDFTVQSNQRLQKAGTNNDSKNS